MKKNNIAL